jgi:hypothetical protein
MSTEDFNKRCAELCSRCAKGEPVRMRSDTGEYCHDWAFGAVDQKLGRPAGMGHGICLAHDFRKAMEGLIDG